ncbi:uncharacterized protein LOC116262062 isoform X2 [Nymphaea colorata]|uniref:uncharacterized protein LOC116262062 isoform X2 n=1 Tax=Nymphaea colorata TaxID=210225 RepID=UPI00214F06B8|nr:uncharacterized protein LOC116262062 isoform X2 [Nymphaea colorata]
MATVAIVKTSTCISPCENRTSDVQCNYKKKEALLGLGEDILKKDNKVELVASLFAVDCTTAQMPRGLKRKEAAQTPKYIDTKMDDVYPVKKLSDVLKLPPRKQNTKDRLDQSLSEGGLKFSTSNMKLRDFSCSSPSGNVSQGFQAKLTTCSQNKFRHVAELSSGIDGFSSSSHIDMDLALKGFAATELPKPSFCASSVGSGNHPGLISSNFCHEVHVLGDKAPLDFTLKSDMRLVSSSSVSWCHRLAVGGGGEVKLSGDVPKLVGTPPKVEALYPEALCSWLYPQTSLPSSVVSSLTISSARGGLAEIDFLSKRQLDWEDSFRSLYYMLRRNMCSIFYVYTSHFVAMFIGGDLLGKQKHSCNAYLSRSTRGLRALLKENDIGFTMPLCRSEVENPTTEDLHELSEFERRNPGQTSHRDHMYDVDNSSESLLAFVGIENVHGLYDILLNYRSFLSSLNSTDVPVLYSPVPFLNASSHSPQVRCKQVRRADTIHCTTGTSHVGIEGDPSSSICYSIEIRDSVLPPWVICRICKVMGLDDKTFEASFTMDPLSIGLNAALCDVSQETHDKSSSDDPSACSFMNAVVNISLRSACIQGLKYKGASYIASLSPA